MGSVNCYLCSYISIYIFFKHKHIHTEFKDRDREIAAHQEHTYIPNVKCRASIWIPVITERTSWVTCNRLMAHEDQPISAFVMALWDAAKAMSAKLHCQLLRVCLRNLILIESYGHVCNQLQIWSNLITAWNLRCVSYLRASILSISILKNKNVS